jgi:methylated-DNA-[protein]-cysteine S-methyltransferase
MSKSPIGVARRVAAYFSGDLHAIDTLPVKTGEMWRALRRIPCGTTVSYGELARRIGRSEAVHAVGLANEAACGGDRFAGQFVGTSPPQHR